MPYLVLLEKQAWLEYRFLKGDNMDYIVREVQNFYKVIKLKEFRKTEGVVFDVMVKSMVPPVHALYRVLH